MIYYKLYQDNRRNAANPGAWYARPAAGQVYDLEDLAEHMAAHDTPFSKGVIYGVLTDMVNCIQELTLDGIAVKIPDLAIFSVGFKSSSSETVKDFNAAENIKAYKLRARATGQYKPQLLKQKVKIKQYDEYKVSTDAPATEPSEPQRPQPPPTPAPSSSPKGGREGWRRFKVQSSRFKAGVARGKGIVQTPKLPNSQTPKLPNS